MTRASRRRVIAVVLAAGAWPARADTPPKQQAARVLTGKERQTGKATDEQRVNDCKVPEAQRTRPRPADCGARP